MTQVSAGMIYLHQERIVHRDLRSANCLVKKGEGGNYEIKIGDFGLSIRVSETGSSISPSSFHKPIRWSAIEVISQNAFSFKSDVWSFGVLVWEIFEFGKIPYSEMNNNEVTQKVSNEGYRLPRPELCPPSLYEFILTFWDSDPEKRPDFPTINAELTQKIAPSIRNQQSAVIFSENENLSTQRLNSSEYNTSLVN